MSYDPPSQQSGGSMPPQDDEKTDSMSSSSMPPADDSDSSMGSMGGPTEGGMSEPSQENMPGTMGQPTMPTGGSMAGGTGQPTMPTGAGGYTPPPSGAYTPPPSGGYSAPPPPPPSGGMAGMSMAGVNQATLQNILQKWMNAVTKPSAATYESEIPNANWMAVIIGLVAVIIVNVIIGLVAAGATAASFNSIRDQLRAQGRDLPFDPGVFTASAGFGSIISTPIGFFLGAFILWLFAKMLGGQNSNFMTHSYLLSLSYAPLRIVAGVLSIIPVLGGLLGLVLGLYQLYSAGLAMQASQRMAPGRAQLAAFLPTIIGVVLGCLCFILVIMGLVAAVNTNNP
jgi:hypothetical protein